MSERFLTFIHISPNLFKHLKICSNHLIKVLIRHYHNILRCLGYSATGVTTERYILLCQLHRFFIHFRHVSTCLMVILNHYLTTTFSE
ncbi:hypothetical protein QL285_067446 [Trifolium repens]|nr:hypothetical protein QL285_067446 [Trifolium repens]